MAALSFIKVMLSEPMLRQFLQDDYVVPDKYLKCDYNELKTNSYLDHEINKMRGQLSRHTERERGFLFLLLQLKAGQYGILTRRMVRRAFSNQTQATFYGRHNIMHDLRKHLNYVIDDMVSSNYLKQIEEGELVCKDRDAVVINSLDGIKIIHEFLLENEEGSDECLDIEEKSRAFLLMTAFPVLHELKDPYKILKFLLELTTELGNHPLLICEACEGQPLALLLIGSFLSFKPRVYHIWEKVTDDLAMIKKSDNGATNNPTGNILALCYDDLPFLLQSCFLYLACYPIGYEIPARSLTKMWIAEGFVEPEEGETTEEAANKYLELLVQRSLVCVSKRSFSDTIKCCRIQPFIHKFAIEQSRQDMFLFTNPDDETIQSRPRLAFHRDDKDFHMEKSNDNMCSFLAFDFDRECYLYANNLLVLELRNSTIPKFAIQESKIDPSKIPNTDFSYMVSLKYLGLRGSKISELPKDINYMKNLQTLDVRDTSIKTLQNSLWTISTLRHIYVNPSPQIKGPPLTANYLSNLQILKTVVVPESWQENFPRFLINLRKLSLSVPNTTNPDEKYNPYVKSISDLLSHMVNLLSMAITCDIMPSEYVDTRAFPNLDTVKSIKLEGKWICRKLYIDNVKFPQNLSKLTLIKSELKEDPMPTLGRLKALKYLSLQDGVYTGKQMVCSANGFPQLRFLQLSKLEDLKNWVVEPKAMSQLTTLHVVNCCKLDNHPDLEHVTDKVYYCKLENHN